MYVAIASPLAGAIEQMTIGAPRGSGGGKTEIGAKRGEAGRSARDDTTMMVIYGGEREMWRCCEWK